MEKFLRNSAWFLGFVIIIICLLQGIISFRIKDKAITGYDNWDTTSNNNADIVLLGSSRCWAHFDPRFFEAKYHLKTVNIGMNGHSELPASILRLENYLSKNKAPKYAVLSFDPSTCPGSYENNTNFVNKNNYARFAFLPSQENVDLINYFKFDYKEKYLPLYALFKYKLVEDAVTLKNSNLFKEGFELNDEQWDTIKNPVSGSMKKHFIKDDEIPLLKTQLLQLKSICTKNNIRLLCIQTPAYKSNYDALVFLRSAVICKSLNITFIDANSLAIRENSNNFYNSTHLNKKGVQEMNKRLKNEKKLDMFFKINP
jgi:hypothetical protein